MSDTPQPAVPPTPAAAPPVQAAPPKPDRLYQVAAWVVIVSGIIFIVVTALFVVCAVWCCH